MTNNPNRPARMPDAGALDSAHDTLPAIRQAISSLPPGTASIAPAGPDWEKMARELVEENGRLSMRALIAEAGLKKNTAGDFRRAAEALAALSAPLHTDQGQPSGVVEALANRLREAADWLSEDIPEGTPEVQHLESAVRLDELDLYCVNLMREAAEAINGYARAIGIASTALETIQGMEPITHEITLATVMAQHAVDALSDIAALSAQESDNG